MCFVSFVSIYILHHRSVKYRLFREKSQNDEPAAGEIFFLTFFGFEILHQKHRFPTKIQPFDVRLDDFKSSDNSARVCIVFTSIPHKNFVFLFFGSFGKNSSKNFSNFFSWVPKDHSLETPKAPDMEPMTHRNMSQDHMGTQKSHWTHQVFQDFFDFFFELVDPKKSTF